MSSPEPERMPKRRRVGPLPLPPPPGEQLSLLALPPELLAAIVAFVEASHGANLVHLRASCRAMYDAVNQYQANFSWPPRTHFQSALCYLLALRGLRTLSCFLDGDELLGRMTDVLTRLPLLRELSISTSFRASEQYFTNLAVAFGSGALKGLESLSLQRLLLDSAPVWAMIGRSLNAGCPNLRNLHIRSVPSLRRMAASFFEELTDLRNLSSLVLTIGLAGDAVEPFLAFASRQWLTQLSLSTSVLSGHMGRLAERALSYGVLHELDINVRTFDPKLAAAVALIVAANSASLSKLRVVFAGTIDYHQPSGDVRRLGASLGGCTALTSLDFDPGSILPGDVNALLDALSRVCTLTSVNIGREDTQPHFDFGDVNIAPLLRLPLLKSLDCRYYLPCDAFALFVEALPGAAARLESLSVTLLDRSVVPLCDALPRHSLLKELELRCPHNTSEDLSLGSMHALAHLLASPSMRYFGTSLGLRAAQLTVFLSGLRRRHAMTIDCESVELTEEELLSLRALALQHHAGVSLDYIDPKMWMYFEDVSS
eukprot:TRINITY_DN3929_c0_g1_i2.p1 TRINITY_DN3929_c0_g1~~TRINITY_DN3929_c0_g1_i2.p1  ORF type:complete len:542 (-),score=84.99 TRINITY_DN3929_c0_g1_i2:58-1683(-)